MAFCQELKNAREKKGISQRELARRVGLATGVVSRFEQGLKVPGLATAKELAEELGVSLDKLVQ